MPYKSETTAAPGNPIVEVIFQAFRGLPKNQRAALGERILTDPGIDDDDLDHLLIARSTRDKGRDMPLTRFGAANRKERATSC